MHGLRWLIGFAYEIKVRTLKTINVIKASVTSVNQLAIPNLFIPQHVPQTNHRQTMEPSSRPTGQLILAWPDP